MKNVKVLGLLPVRSGSKGLPGKNIRPLLGKPLLTWSASALSESLRVTRKICCSDSEQMLALARDAGLSTPWIRPAELAGDESMIVDVLLHAIDRASKYFEETYDYAVIVQATSPTVTPNIIDGAIEFAVSSHADTVITGYEANSNHPSLMYQCKSNGEVQWLSSSQSYEARRQDFERVFVRTGVVYVVRVSSLLRNSSLYGEKVLSFPIAQEKAIAIDTEYDFRLAELIIKLDRRI